MFRRLVNPTFRRLLREARPYYGRLVIGSLLGVIAGVVPVTMARVAELLRSDVLVQHPNWDVLAIVIALVMGSQILGNAASYGQAYLTAYSGQKMVATFRARMFDRIARMPLAEFDRWRAGELQSRMSADLGLMTDAISISLPQFVQVTFTFIAALVYMIARDW